MAEMYDAKLLKEILGNFYNPRTVFYGFNVINDEAPLVQTGSGYRTMAVVDSALTSGNSSELACSKIIYREENKLSFVIPQNYVAVVAFVRAVCLSGVDNKYMRLMLGYGENGNTLKEICRSNQTSVNRTNEMIMFGSYAGLVADSDTAKHKIVVETYGAQSYSSVNVIIGVVL